MTEPERPKRETEGETLFTVPVKKRHVLFILTVLISPGSLALWKAVDAEGNVESAAEVAADVATTARRAALKTTAEVMITADQCEAGYDKTRTKLDQLAEDFHALKAELVYQSERVDRFIAAAHPVTQRRYRAPRRPAPEEVPVSPVVADPLPPTLADAAKEAK